MDIHVDFNGEHTALSFPSDATAEDIQTALDEAANGRVRVAEPGGVSVGVVMRAHASSPATEDKQAWVEASWSCINGGEPSRERRFHASGCRWQPRSRKWSCASDCNVPQWMEEEAAADE